MGIMLVKVTACTNNKNGTANIYVCKPKSPQVQYGPVLVGSDHRISTGDTVVVADLGSDMTSLVVLSKYPYGS